MLFYVALRLTVFIALRLSHSSFTLHFAICTLKLCILALTPYDLRLTVFVFLRLFCSTATPQHYFRFHGRNAKDWWTGDAETRYKYLYSPEEIAELAGRVKAAAEKVKMLFAFFNNHWQAYAPRNANDLKKALQLPFEQLPMNLEMIQDIQNTESKKGTG